MNCPTCGEEKAKVLFFSTECINKECKNYSENHAKELAKKNWSNLTSLSSSKEDDELDEDLDNAFQLTFGWTGP